MYLYLIYLFLNITCLYSVFASYIKYMFDISPGVSANRQIFICCVCIAKVQKIGEHHALVYLNSNTLNIDKEVIL